MYHNEIVSFSKKVAFAGRIIMVVLVRLNLKDYSKGDAIKFIREWTNLTQKDFAKRIGKSKRTIEQYEAGKVNYGIDTLKIIAKEFNIDIIIEKK